VTVLGAQVPVSGWTPVVLVGGVAISLLAWRRLARWRRWGPGATLAALLWFTVVVALTLTPYGDQPSIGLDACIPADWNDFVFNVLHTGGGISGDLLNLLLLMPLTISLVLASHRVLPAVVAVLLPLAIELAQTQLPGRWCGVTDALTNGVGALFGIAVGLAAQRLPRRPRPGLSPSASRAVGGWVDLRGR
jgi:VanZ like family